MPVGDRFERRVMELYCTSPYDAYMPGPSLTFGPHWTSVNFDCESCAWHICVCVVAVRSTRLRRRARLSMEKWLKTAKNLCLLSILPSKSSAFCGERKTSLLLVYTTAESKWTYLLCAPVRIFSYPLRNCAPMMSCTIHVFMRQSVCRGVFEQAAMQRRQLEDRELMYNHAATLKKERIHVKQSA